MRWFKVKKRAAAQAGGFGGVQDSPASLDNPKNVVVVMDGMKGLTIETIRTALETNIIPVGCTVTLLGVMSWPNVPRKLSNFLTCFGVISRDKKIIFIKYWVLSSNTSPMSLQFLLNHGSMYGPWSSTMRPKKMKSG